MLLLIYVFLVLSIQNMLGDYHCEICVDYLLLLVDYLLLKIWVTNGLARLPYHLRAKRDGASSQVQRAMFFSEVKIFNFFACLKMMMYLAILIELSSW